MSRGLGKTQRYVLAVLRGLHGRKPDWWATATEIAAIRRGDELGMDLGEFLTDEKGCG